METIYEIASQYRDLFLGFHLFAMVIGLGGATYTDIILVSFLKDKKIDKKESEVIHTMSKAVTIGVFLALISGIVLFLATPEELKQSTAFSSTELYCQDSFTSISAKNTTSSKILSTSDK